MMPDSVFGRSPSSAWSFGLIAIPMLALAWWCFGFGCEENDLRFVKRYW
jgi:hypothetical protein